MVDQLACQEIIRRYYKAACDYKQGKGTKAARHKIEMIMQQLNLSPEDRPCVLPARKRREEVGAAAAAIQLANGEIVTGRASNLMSASSAAILNAIKAMAGIDREALLIQPEVLEPILKLKINILGSRSSVLKVDDVLAALSITATRNPPAALAMEQLPNLRDLDMHSSQMLHNGDEGTLRKLGLRLTCDPEYPSKDLYF